MYAYVNIIDKSEIYGELFMRYLATSALSNRLAGANFIMNIDTN